MHRLLLICVGLIFSGAIRGTAQPNVTSYAAMTTQLKSDAAHSSLLRLTSLGKSAGGQKDLWLVRAADPTQSPANTFRLLVLCRQHGDEPASTEAVLRLLHRLASGGDSVLRQTLPHLTLYVIPMVNPDGADANSRANAVGADLNRDWGVFQQPETRAVARAAQLIQPNFVLDAHNWDDSDEYNADCLEVPRETETAAGKTEHALQRDAVDQLATLGYTLHPTAWGPDTDPRLAHRWFAHQNILSALVETHSGSPTDQTDFQSRQGLYTALIHMLARRYAAVPVPETSAPVSDAALFPSAAAPSAHLQLRRPVSRLWIWALGLYGLVLWAVWKAPLQRTNEAQAPPRRTSPPPSRRGSRKRSTGEITLPQLLSLPVWEGGGLVRRGGADEPAGFYSLKKKREGTEIKVRSGQRRAVSIPPR